MRRSHVVHDDMSTFSNSRVSLGLDQNIDMSLVKTIGVTELYATTIKCSTQSVIPVAVSQQARGVSEATDNVDEQRGRQTLFRVVCQLSTEQQVN